MSHSKGRWRPYFSDAVQPWAIPSHLSLLAVAVVDYFMVVPEKFCYNYSKLSFQEMRPLDNYLNFHIKL